MPKARAGHAGHAARHGKEQHGAPFGFADAAQLADLHHGDRRHGPGAHAHDRGHPLVVVDTGPQHGNHAQKAHRHSHDAHGVALRAAPAQHPTGDEKRRGVVQAGGGGQGQVRDGEKAQPHRRDAGQVAP
ncbi:hypothetical protein G6F46_014442 [Rhizopus delemar]|nr:hypothetical protein G6F46_014442 [Rhizopus delemar]